MPRLFVGVPAPDDLELSGARNALTDRARGVKLVDPELYHVTVAFLGDTSESQIGPVLDAMDVGAAGVPPHEGRAEGLGAFPHAERASVVWAGVAGTRMAEIAQATRAALDERSIGFDDRHDFHPHLTIARLRDKQDISSLLTPHEGTDFGAFPVEVLHLYESTLTPEGPEYEVRGSVDLEGKA